VSRADTTRALYCNKNEPMCVPHLHKREVLYGWKYSVTFPARFPSAPNTQQKSTYASFVQHIATITSIFIFIGTDYTSIIFSLALQPSAGYPRGFLITHNDTPHSVGLLWTSDQFVAETSIWLHTHKRQTSMPPVGFEPTIAAGERL
jgi:hypothetical protein